jgi:hypothetical protein
MPNNCRKITVPSSTTIMGIKGLNCIHEETVRLNLRNG